MRQNRFGNLIAHTHYRIQSSHRLLKNHSNLRAAQLTHLLRRKLEQVAGGVFAVLEQNFSRNPRLHGQQPHQRQRCD